MSVDVELPPDVVVVDGEQYPQIEGELILANREIERLQAVVADQALTIGTLKDEIGSLTTRLQGAANANAQFRAQLKLANDELDETRSRMLTTHRLLEDERSLSAATSEHTTALERKVALLLPVLEAAKFTVDQWTSGHFCRDTVGAQALTQAVFDATNPGAAP